VPGMLRFELTSKTRAAMRTAFRHNKAGGRKKQDARQGTLP
jgi:hypothetical protein